MGHFASPTTSPAYEHCDDEDEDDDD